MINNTKLCEELKECVAATPPLLPQVDCEILTLRYGLGGEEGLGIVATAKKLEMSPELVHATEKRAISYLSLHGYLAVYGQEITTRPKRTRK